MDKKFTDISYRVTDWFGRWPVVVIGLLLLFGWVLLGQPMHYSDTWQLIANTPTTWIEFFLGLFTLAAANRAEQRTKEILETLIDNQKKELLELENDTQILIKENEILKEENRILKDTAIIKSEVLEQ